MRRWPVSVGGAVGGCRRDPPPRWLRAVVAAVLCDKHAAMPGVRMRDWHREH